MTHSTTILCVRRNEQVAIGSDGQVTMGETVVKADARKIRRLYNGRVLVGFAGATADAFSLMEKFESKLEEHQGNVLRATYELARDWRTDRVLRRLQSLMVVVDQTHHLLVSGSGEVIEPSEPVLGIGSGGAYAVAAARAMLRNTELSAPEIVRKSLEIAGEICIYTNTNITVEEL